MKPLPAPSRLYRASKTFWANFHALSPAQRKLVLAAWVKFRRDPFDPALRTHKIHALSARRGETIYSVVVDGDLRVLFCLQKNVVFTIDVGTHKIYGR